MKFNEALKSWNGGIERGAQTRLARAIGVNPATVSQWSNDLLRPGEEMARKIAKEFEITPEQVLAMFSPGKLKAPAGVDMGSLNANVPLLAVLGRGAADRFSIAFDAPPEEMIPNPQPGKRLFALRVSGDCMEPALADGDFLYIDPNAIPADKKVVLAQLDGEYTIKRYRVFADGAYLVPDNKKYPRIKIASNKVTIKGVAAGKFQREI